MEIARLLAILLQKVWGQVAMAEQMTLARAVSPTILHTGEYYCPVCHMLLNGHPQWKDHKRGKKHNTANIRHRRLDQLQQSGACAATNVETLNSLD